ncbi:MULTISPECIES: alpha/beta hydrolase [Thioalkalivibrio]|uniref:lipase family alpha/beta hydrolase n=1 Tax=Thioalkalivibrio TaxID=106633 RepID=UPI00035CDC24|nr:MULTISPECIES: alpha/beta hydrolase [Thioalkalivibrio]
MGVLRVCAVLAVVMGLVGCSLLDAREQLARMGGACVISGTVGSNEGADGSERTGPYVVAVFREPVAGAVVPEPADHVVSARGGSWFFALEPGRYSVLAFRDEDGDRAHPAGAPVQHVARGDSLDCGPGGRLTGIDIRVNGNDRLAHAIRLPDTRGPGDGAAPDPAPLSLGRVTAYGEIAHLEDPRFATEVARGSQWRPLDFVLSGYAGVYFLEPYDPARTPVLFVHGMNGSPRDFAGLLEGLDRERYQPWFYYYASGLPLQSAAAHLAQVVEELEVRHGVESLPVVAHSMGGLIARGFLNERARREAAATVPAMITLSTPWAGHERAQRGVDRSPVVIPVWRDMAPGSDYLEGLFADANTEVTELHLLFGYQRGEGGARATADGVVTLASMLHPPAQREAASVFGVATTHAGILSHPLVLERVDGLLSGVQGD